MKNTFRAFVLVFGLLGTEAQAETLTNQSIITLSQAGIGSDTILAKIRNSATAFDMSTDQLVALKQANIPDQVIAAMLDASNGALVNDNAVANQEATGPLSPHAPGIYVQSVWKSENSMTQLDPSTTAASSNSGMLAYAFTYGVAKVRSKAILNTEAARVRIPQNKPVFYFYFDEASSSLSHGTNPWSAIAGSASVTSPNEFTLLHLDVKKGNREFETGSFNIAGSNSGSNAKQRISFSYEKVAPGVFKVTPDINLAEGEYGFIYSSSTSGPLAAYGVQLQAPRIFDFAIISAQ